MYVHTITFTEVIDFVSVFMIAAIIIYSVLIKPFFFFWRSLGSTGKGEREWHENLVKSLVFGFCIPADIKVE